MALTTTFGTVVAYLRQNFDGLVEGAIIDGALLHRPVPLDQFGAETLTFCSGASLPDGVRNATGGMIICGPDTETGSSRSQGPVIVRVARPRLVFGKVVERFFAVTAPRQVHPTSQIDTTAEVGANASIGAFCVIGPDCRIGQNCRIGSNVVIGPNVIIGDNCKILSGCVIGEAGFGVETDANGETFRLPHIGGVILEDNVHVGSMCSIASGTLVPTVLRRSVQLDNLVHIAHNVDVGARTLITACAEVSGSVRIGEDCWLGPNCSIMNKISIGDKSMVGLGAVVTKSVRENVIVAGAPARVLKERYPDEAN